MIKVCSLDFLNRSTFDVDIMSSDGRILFTSGSEANPENLLWLYFKDIYIAEPACKNKNKPAEADVIGKLDTINLVQSIEEIMDNNLDEASGGTLSDSEDKPVETDVIEGSETLDLIQSNEKTTENDLDEAIGESFGGLGNSSGRTGGTEGTATSDIIQPTEKTTDNDLDEALGGESFGGLGNKSGRTGGTEGTATSDIIQPKEEATENDLDEALEEPIGGIGNTSAETSAIGGRAANSSIKPIEETIENDENKALEFDEPQAERVAKYSVKLGQRIGMQKQQIDELETAAYYHNIGRTKFTVADLSQKAFKRKQAVAGHNILITEKNLSEKIAEAALFYNISCKSTQIDLNDTGYFKLPYSHIVAITSFYDELLAKGMSKDGALKKMLQIGGNKFNIFILHKFINMMRETND